jgi:flagellar hook-associated protein 3 FlgL
MAVSTIAQAQQVIQSITALQTQGNMLEQQIATGIKSPNYADYAPQAAQIVNLSATESQQNAYLTSIATVGTRLQAMSQVTSTIASLTGQFANTLQNDAYNTQGATVQETAQQLLAQIGDYLNTQDGEGYVFSGAENSTAPVNLAALPAPGDLVTAVNGAPPAGYYTGDASIASAPVDNNLTLTYGVTAANPAFEQAIRALNYLANAPAFDQNNPADVANVNQATDLLNTATSQIQQLNATMGLQQSQLNSLQQSHQSTLSLAQSSLADIENVDPATAITQLDTLQTQLEASYQTVNMLQSLSLANYLK